MMKIFISYLYLKIYTFCYDKWANGKSEKNSEVD